MQKKIVSNRRLKSVLLPIAISIFTLGFLHPEWFLHAITLCATGTLCMLCIICYRATLRTPPHSKSQGLTCGITVAACQLAGTVVFITLVNSLRLTDPGITQATAQQCIQQQLVNYALFPWSLYTVTLIAFLHLRQTPLALTCSALFSVPNQLGTSLLQLLCDLSGRLSAVLSITLTLYGLVFMALYLFEIHWLATPLHMGVTLPHLLLISVTITLANHAAWQRYIQRQLTAGRRFGVLVLGSALCLLIVVGVLHNISNAFVTGPIATSTLTWINPPTETLYLHLIGLSWWIGLARLYAAYLVDLHKALSLRSILIINLWLPTVFAIIGYMQPQAIAHLAATVTQHHAVIYALFAISLALCGLFLWRSQRLGQFLLVGEIDNSQRRAQPRPYATRWFFTFILIMPCVYLTGLRLPSLFAGIGLWQIILILLGASSILTYRKHAVSQ